MNFIVNKQRKILVQFYICTSTVLIHLLYSVSFSYLTFLTLGEVFKFSQSDFESSFEAFRPFKMIIN